MVVRSRQPGHQHAVTVRVPEEITERGTQRLNFGEAFWNEQAPGSSLICNSAPPKKSVNVVEHWHSLLVDFVPGKIPVCECYMCEKQVTACRSSLRSYWPPKTF
jgi:hypothetical protein